MKKVITLTLMMAASCGVFAQDAPAFNFESGLNGWKTSKGKVYTTTEYFREGKQSLAWEAPVNAELSVTFTPLDITSHKAATCYIHSPQSSSDILVMRFYNGNALMREARIQLNFSGWRAFNRAYSDYAGDVYGPVDRVVFVRTSHEKKTVILHFDDMQFNRDADKEFIAGTHMSSERKEIQHGTTLLDLYNHPVDIVPDTATWQEIEGIRSIAALCRLPYEKANDKQLERARDFVQALDLKRNKDGRVTGRPVELMKRMSNDEFLSYISPLGALASSVSDKQLCRDYIDYLLEQGIAEGVNYQMKYSDYAVVRKVPLALFAAIQMSTDIQRIELLKLIKWLTEYGKLYYPERDYLSTMNADILTNYLQYYLAYALEQPREAMQVAEMKAFSRFLCRQTEYTPGDCGILKADGTGFHHKSHYNNYMYAYRYWINAAYMLKGTPFRIRKEAFERMSKAVISMYLMMGRDKNDNRFTANALSGRNAYYKAGAKVQVYKKEFVQLIEIGGDIQGVAFDSNLASAFNYFFMTDKYDVPTVCYDGFYQFNHSPAGVYRTGEWVVVMRSPTTKFWGSEIYNKTNRLGRYQSHGSVEVIYNGGLSASGLPVNEDCGGWDWNVIPGTTTIHYTDWENMMPSANVSDRFDQYTLTKDFSGALAWGDMGMFAADFDQIDRWGGKQNYKPTNLTYKKSVFACDGMLFCLGSDINASGNYDNDMITATNLFQEINSKKSGTFMLNGVHVKEGHHETLTPDKVHYALTPMSTGYIIPAGNDPLTVKFGLQKTPKQTGEDVADPKVSQVAAKAYLNHGVKTNGKQYAFIVMPQTGNEQLKKIAAHITQFYHIEHRDEHVHAFLYIPKEIHAYAFFAPINGLEGIIEGASTQLLLMTKPEGYGKRSFAICNPNHNPKSDSQFGWISQPSKGYFTLKGEWNGNGTQMVIEHKNGNTIVNYELSEGMPQYFILTQK